MERQREKERERVRRDSSDGDARLRSFGLRHGDGRILGGGAVTLPGGFQDSTAIAGLESPIAIDFAPDGRV